MSISALNFALNLSLKLSPVAQIVLIRLSDDADFCGRVRFSLDSLAHNCNLTQTETQAMLDELAQRELIMFKPSNMPKREHEPWLELHLRTQYWGTN